MGGQSIRGDVKNNSVNIDVDGIHVKTDISRIETLVTNNSFKIVDSGNRELSFFGYDEDLEQSDSRMDNLSITKYLNVGKHRVQEYNDRTGWFYIIGGVE